MSDKKNIHQRIAQVMGKVSYIQKESKQGMRYSIVSHDAVTAKLRPAIIEAGITYYPVSISHSQDGNRTECAMIVRFTNVEDPSDFIDVHSLGYGIDQQDKGPGKAQSYAVKYALLKTFGLETGDEPDEDQFTSHIPASIEQLQVFEDEVATATSIDALTAALERHGDTIAEASTHDAARVAKAKQAFKRKKQALSKETEDA